MRSKKNLKSKKLNEFHHRYDKTKRSKKKLNHQLKMMMSKRMYRKSIALNKLLVTLSRRKKILYKI